MHYQRVDRTQASPWPQYAAKTSVSGEISRANSFYFGVRNCCVAALAAVCCQNQPERRRRPCKLLLHRLSKLRHGTFWCLESLNRSRGPPLQAVRHWPPLCELSLPSIAAASSFRCRASLQLQPVAKGCKTAAGS